MTETKSIFPQRASGVRELVVLASNLSITQSSAYVAAALAVLGLLDWLTGTSFTLSSLYFLPIILASWSIGFRAGLLVGALAAAIQVGLNGFGDSLSAANSVAPAAALWNFGMRIVGVCVLVTIVTGFRDSYRHERELARTDALTGALTKFAFRDHLRMMLGSARRRPPVLVFVYTDLDGFKQVNDQHGHATGDSVLVGFTDVVTGILRPRDILARVGGDEFALLLPVFTIADGYATAERLHREISKGLDDWPYDVTCSMGAIVVEHGSPNTEDTFLAMADSLMYEVKRAGKNALRVAHVDLDVPAPSERIAA